jgi:NAD(P)-dependent dehydrogenase (short-subunit alcohol dehydrogenase family)
VALVTGGSRGIGEMIARAYVENGAKVYITARKAEACDALANELSKSGECISIPGDISRMDEIDRLGGEIEKRAKTNLTFLSTTPAPAGGLISRRSRNQDGTRSWT